MTAESPETPMLDDRDPTAVVQAVELQLGAEETDWERVEDAGRFLTALARREGGGRDD
jgi:hypothetical protein